MLTDFGRNVTPYAFNLRTCKKINKYFFNGGYIKQRRQWILREGSGGLPFDATRDDLEPAGCLLDILYILCTTYEVAALGQLKVPSGEVNPNESRSAKDIIENTLKEMFRAGRCRFWTKSPLRQMVEDEYDWANEQFDKECLMRAIIVWHWTQGKRIEQIRSETKFNFVPPVVGDIARLAETIAYQLEAISHMNYRGKEAFQHLKPSDIYRLSTRVNYGVPENLVNIANRHVHALERKAILDIGDLYKKRELDYTSPMQMLRAPKASDIEAILQIIDREKLEELLKSADDSNVHEKIEPLLDGMDDAKAEALKELYYARPAEGDKYLLPWLNNLSDENFVVDFPIKDRNFATLELDGKKFILIAQTGEDSEAAEDDYGYQIDRELKSGSVKLIIMSTELEDHSDMFEGLDVLSTTFESFAGLIAQSIKLTDLSRLSARFGCCAINASRRRRTSSRRCSKRGRLRIASCRGERNWKQSASLTSRR